MKKDKTAAVINLFKAAILLSIVSLIWLSYKLLLIEKIVLTLGIAVCAINDFLRIRYWQEKKTWAFNLSIVASIAGAGFYCYLLHDLPTSIYFIFPLAEIFAHGPNPFCLVPFHFAAFLALTFLFGKTFPLVELFTYAGILLILFLFRSISMDRKKEQRLNEELTSANAKLKEYSAYMQKMAIVKERTRIAQELHDSIGHGLVALGMNLEFAENILGVDTVKAEAAIQRAHGQAQNCMTDLRKAVTALKNDETDQPVGLKESLNRLFNLLESEQVQCNLTFDPHVEQESQSVRDCLFKMVREALTNGIRHGKASDFTINISSEAGNTVATVKDNGTGCAEFDKSDGLTGIENRAALIGGKVSYSSLPGDGFCIRAVIPSTQRIEEDIL